jgi:hypothetical protein
MRRRRIELDSFTPGGPLSEVVENEKGGLTIVIGPPRFLRARKLLKDGDPPAAVLAAQATSEAHVKRLLRDLMELAGLTEITLKRSRSLAFHRENKELLAWYERLSGDRSHRSQRFWRSGRLTKHIERRNRIVYEGHVCSRMDAQQSIDVLQELSDHLEGVVGALKAARSQSTRGGAP